MRSETLIPWAKPTFWGNEEKYLIQALRSTWISEGPFIKRLEDQFCDYFNSHFALAVSNGTTALHLAYLGLGLKPGDEVILPGFGFMGAANVAIHMGAKPIFVEVDKKTWCLSAKCIKDYISPKTKIVVPIHTYGNVCNMDEILEIANERNIHVLEDAAEALGSKYRNKFAGSISEIGIYSLHATKTITTGEGGIVVTNNEKLYKKMYLYRSHGLLRKKHYWHDAIGHNFRMTNLQAALGVAQFEHIDKIISIRKKIHSQYKEILSNVGEIELQYFNDYIDPVLWAIALKLNISAFPQGRDKVIEQLKEVNIETRPGFYTPSQMRHLYNCKSLPVCEETSQNVISLPTFASLSHDQITYICEQLLLLRQ